MSTPRRRAVRLVAALVALAALAGCGVSTGGDPEGIAASEVPYGLLSRAPASPAPTSVPPVGDHPRIYLVSPDDSLVPTGRTVEGDSGRDRLADLLAQLTAGPTADERDAQLTTALPPGAELSVSDIDGDTVTIDLTGPGEAPSGLDSRRAVAQIVLTATGLPGVRAVLLTGDGDPLEAPLPSGRLTTEPLEAADFAQLLVASDRPSTPVTSGPR